MSSIGNEVVLYIARSPSGFKVEIRDGTGLADGIFAKRDTRYFTGESPKEDAESYAEKKAEEHDYRIQYAPMVEA
jgi:hypothetical protein